MNLPVLENVKTFHLASTKENFDDKKLASSYDYIHLNEHSWQIVKLFY